MEEGKRHQEIARDKLWNQVSKKYLKEILSYASPNDVLGIASVVSKQWKSASLCPKLWTNFSKKKWAMWKEGQLKGFEFMFREGLKEEELKEKQQELGIIIPHDIVSLMKECSAVGFPANLFYYSFNPIICLLSLLDWRFPWFSPTWFSPHYVAEGYDPSHQYMMIGFNNYGFDYKYVVLLDTQTWRVIGFQEDEAEFTDLCSFNEWFASGTTFPQFLDSENVTKDEDTVKEIIDRYDDYVTFGQATGEVERWASLKQQFTETFLQGMKKKQFESAMWRRERSAIEDDY